MRSGRIGCRRWIGVGRFNIKKGTPLRLRGLTIGFVLNAINDRNAILAMANINANTTIIPKSSSVERSQTGLFSETAIDTVPLYHM